MYFCHVCSAATIYFFFSFWLFPSRVPTVIYLPPSIPVYCISDSNIRSSCCCCTIHTMRKCLINKPIVVNYQKYTETNFKTLVKLPAIVIHYGISALKTFSSALSGFLTIKITVNNTMTKE